MMTGIQFLTDEKGRKVAVQIDLRKHGALWEDFYDGLVSEKRRKETGVSLETVKADLSKRGRDGLAQKRKCADVIRDLLDFGKGRKLEGTGIREIIEEGRRL
jgi:hypothetical protein